MITQFMQCKVLRLNLNKIEQRKIREQSISNSS